MKLVDDVITVYNQAVAQSWLHIMQRMKSDAEPTGAFALAVALSEEFNEKYPTRNQYISWRYSKHGDKQSRLITKAIA